VMPQDDSWHPVERFPEAPAEAVDAKLSQF
jgi:hypothetical protein